MLKKLINFCERLTKGSSGASDSSPPRASDSSPPRASVSFDPVKKFKRVNCYIQQKNLTFVNCELDRDDSGEISNFNDFKQMIIRQLGISDIILLFKKMPSSDEIIQIAVNNGFKPPIGFQTIEEISDGGIETNTFIFNIYIDFNKELNKYYVIFEDDEVEVTLNLGLSRNGKNIFIDQNLTNVKQTLFLQIGHIRYILQFGKKLTWDQLEIVLDFLKIIDDNRVEQVVAQEYYKECTNEELKKTYICKGGSIEFDCGVIQLTEILSHGSILLGIDNTIGRCHLKSVLSENSCRNHREDLEKKLRQSRENLDKLKRLARRYATHIEMSNAVSEKKKNVRRRNEISASSKGENPNESRVYASSNVEKLDESSVSASSNVEMPDKSSVSASSNVEIPNNSRQKQKIILRNEKSIKEGFYIGLRFKH